MRIHDTRPPTDAPYARTIPTAWGYDYGTRGHVDRERPFVDDEPAHGSRPARDLPAPKGFLQRAWSRFRSAVASA